MSSTKKEMSIGTLTGAIGLIASIATGTMFISDIKKDNAIQDERIAAIQKSMEEYRTDQKEINDKLTALLIKNGVDLKAVNSLNQKK